MDNLKLINVGYYKAPRHLNIKPHMIPAGIEYIELLTNGKVRFEIGSKEREFECGAMFWHKEGDLTIYKNDPENPYECLYLRFQKLREDEDCAECPRVSIWASRDEAISFADKIISAFHDDSFRKEIISDYVYSKIKWEAYSFLRKKPYFPLSGRISGLMDYIDKNFAQDLTVEDLAKAAETSASHIHALSKKVLKTSPHNYLLNRRLQEARKLLITTNYEIKQISSDCGFMNVETFCHVFKRKYFVSPGKFRKENSPKNIFNPH